MSHFTVLVITEKEPTDAVLEVGRSSSQSC